MKKKEGFRLGDNQFPYAKGVIARKAGLEVCGVILALGDDGVLLLFTES